MTYEYEPYDAERDEYLKAHPRTGIIPKQSAQPEPTGSFMCQECRRFFDIVDGPDGLYGGIQKGRITLCSTCHLAYQGKHNILWREVYEAVSNHTQWLPEG